MSSAALALLVVAAFLIIIFPLRALRRRHLFGSLGGVELHPGRPRSWLVADLLFLAGFAAVVAGPALVLADLFDPLAEPPSSIRMAGVLLGIAATVLAVWAQETMGAAWRTDIGTTPDVPLVTDGPFRWTRNPNYLAMLLAAGATLAIAPTVIGAIGWLVLLVSLRLTVRAEEPPLSEKYGDEYRDYAARTGRFIPGIGRL